MLVRSVRSKWLFVANPLSMIAFILAHLIPYSGEQKHVSISDTPMLLIEINSISNMERQK